MKKGIFAIGSVIVAGSLFAGYTLADEKESTKEPQPTEDVESKGQEVPEVVGEGEDGRPLFGIDSYLVEATEFTTLDSFVQSQFESWKQGSEYRSISAEDIDAEVTIANATLHYVNYFEKDIAEKGMTEDFEEWQLIAYDIVNNHGIDDNEAKHEELAKKFEDKLNEIVSKF